MGNLDLNTRAITCIGLAATGTAVLHILQDRQCIGNNFMTLVALDIGNKSYSARIVLKFWAIQSLVACHFHAAVFRNNSIK